MDWLLEKSTELGVAEIVVVKSERAEVHLDEERASKRREHWQRVVISACEQSGRAVVPQVLGLLALDQFLSQAGTDSVTTRLVLQPEGPAFSTLPQGNVAAIDIAIGPEGGWSERDLQQFALSGFKCLGLGPRVMRTETAGLAAISALQCAYGDFR